jgi:transcriptional regulator with XRE-family HTH domain
MEERLVQLLNAEGINSTRFAERIGVQRSSISHILSGRNKPSYDFIIKILENFPAVNPDWLLRGKGLMYKNDVPVQPGLFDKILSGTKSSAETGIIDKIPVTNDSEDQASYELRSSTLKSIEGKDVGSGSNSKKNIEKIVIFYSDKTFSDYIPDS